jgi:hypothetical protein
VVRIVCLSGLDVLDVFSGDRCKGVDVEEGRDSSGGMASQACGPMFPATTFFEEEVLGVDLRLSMSGRASSVYVTAGIVPFPIQPCSCCPEAPAFGVSDVGLMFSR